MLITPTEINTIAFITPLPEANFKESNILAVEEKIKLLLGIELYNEVNTNPANHPDLLNNFIKPYMAYAIKSLTLNTIISDGNLSSDEVSAYRSAMYSSNQNAVIYYNQLVSYLSDSYSIKRNIVSGFLT